MRIVKLIFFVISTMALGSVSFAQNTYPWPSTGNVGIGMTAPTTALDINGSFHTANNTQLVPASNGNGGLEILWNRSNGGAEVNFYNLYNGASLSYLFSQKTGATTYADLMAIYPNGSVMIGSSSNPGTNKLAVEGTIAARKVIVTLANPWPDYVFLPEYQLPPLNDVAKFIQANHRLPEMPAADSVAKSGLDLVSNQAALLKKIEELTLYAIEQQRQMEELRNENKKMDARLNKLEAALNK